MVVVVVEEVPLVEAETQVVPVPSTTRGGVHVLRQMLFYSRG